MILIIVRTALIVRFYVSKFVICYSNLHYTRGYVFILLSPAMKELIKKLNFEFSHSLARSLIGKILRRFNFFTYMVKSFATLLGIIVMNNILQEIITNFRQEILKSNKLVLIP